MSTVPKFKLGNNGKVIECKEYVLTKCYSELNKLFSAYIRQNYESYFTDDIIHIIIIFTRKTTQNIGHKCKCYGCLFVYPYYVIKFNKLIFGYIRQYYNKLISHHNIIKTCIMFGNPDDIKQYISNKTLIKNLSENAPLTHSKKSKERKDCFYDMISTEHLRKEIIDLIEGHNKILNNKNDIITMFMINKLLSKWKGENFRKLYLRLIEEYEIRNRMKREEIVKHCEIKRLSECYKIGKTLGRGAFAVVKLAERLRDNQLFAVKIINKKGLNKWDLRGLKWEVHIMRELEHENVIKLYDVFESDKKLCFIMEYLKGGELLDNVLEKGCFNEIEATHIFAQILHGLAYVHSKRIAHRSIKPDDMVFNIKIKDWNNIPNDALKIVDWGLAEKCKKSRGLTEYCGTPVYMAPEIYDYKEYDYSCDMWSAGCVLYALLAAYLPFDFDDNQDIKQLSRSIRNDPVEFDPEYWSEISEDAKDLILKLLQRDPKQRYTAIQALNHKWMKSATFELFKYCVMNEKKVGMAIDDDVEITNDRVNKLEREYMNHSLSYWSG